VNPRLAAVLVLALAAGTYFGVAVPLRTRAAATRAEFAHAREERRQTRARLVSLERGRAARERAAALLASARATSGDASGVVRRAVVGALEGARVSDVRLSVRPGRPPVGAAVTLSADGRFTEVMRLLASLARPETGLVLESVQLLSRPSSLTLQLQALGALQPGR
jgi:hypothetical protein